MRSLTLESPAKVNLYLRVLGRRPDGYHDIVTLFHRISLADELILTKRPRGFSLAASDPDLPRGEENLITRAYRLLQNSYPKIGGVSVELKKRIPVGAGLGGGSSNAATFLLGMKRLYGLRIPRKKLFEMGKKLGADLPFFLLQTRQAVGTGRGDRLTRVPTKKNLWFLLILSRQGLSTRRVYQSLGSRGPSPLTKARQAVRLLSNLLETEELRRVAKHLRNDLEHPVFRLRPSLRKTINRLKKLGAPAVRMSGSGPTLFAVFSSRQEALDFAEKFRSAVPSQEMVVCHSL